ncbi:MAG: exosortase/archaeosortase family protein [Desulfobacteraceae bacterium]|jgi:exosortase
MKAWILFIIWAAIFYPIYPSLIQTWIQDSNNSHGILVPFISAFFAWQQRDQLGDCKVEPQSMGGILLVLSLFIYVVSYAGAVTVAIRISMVSSLICLILYNFGKDVFMSLMFPLLFLFFMIPVPVSITSLISLPLQTLATNISTVIIRLASIPVYQEGHMLYFVETQLEVAEACSGIHSIVALLMLSTVLVHYFPMTLKYKIIIIFSAIPIALFANIVRVSGTGILAHFYGASVARGFLHQFSGMAVFVFGLFLLGMEYRIIRKIEKIKRTFLKGNYNGGFI